MAGTRAHLDPLPFAPLPIPKVRLTAATPLVVSPTVEHATGNVGPNLTWLTSPEVVAVDISDDLLDPRLGLQLELGRYRPQHNSPLSVRSGHAAIVHPSTWVGAVALNGHDTRGGAHNTNAGIVAVDRISEWAVTARNQVTLVDLSPWFQLLNVDFFNAGTLALDLVEVPCPSGLNKGRIPGRRFPYSPRFQPGYFYFRYSVIGLRDGRRGRVAGAWTPAAVVATCDPFPFIHNAAVSQAQGRAYADLAGGDTLFDVMRCWLETRLPRG